MSVIPSQQKQYSDPIMVKGFGALPVVPVAANDNVDVRQFGARGSIFDESGASAGFEIGGVVGDNEYIVPKETIDRLLGRGQYIGLTRNQRHGDFMQTYTGRKFWPMDPRADEVFVEDIAHALSLQCRYAGHCHRFYSVAEHSVLMARHLRWEGVDVALFALLHDASEAYLVDVPRPVKPFLEGYKAAENKVMAAICDRFGLPHEMPAVVHDADNRIIGDELVNMTPMDWHGRYNEPLGVTLRYWSPTKAEEEFMATFDALMDCRARGME